MNLSRKNPHAFVRGDHRTGVTRRGFLGGGALALGGLSLADAGSHSLSAAEPERTARPGDTAEQPLDIGSRLELFVDRHLIDKMDGVALRLHRPMDAGVAFE